MPNTVLITEAILTATDGTEQLRDMPNDDIHPVLAARRESSEQDFIALMCRFVLPHRTTNA